MGLSQSSSRYIEAESCRDIDRRRAGLAERGDIKAALQNVENRDRGRRLHRYGFAGERSANRPIVRFNHGLTGAALFGGGDDFHDDRRAAHGGDGVGCVDLDGLAGLQARAGHVQGDLAVGQIHDGRLSGIFGDGEIRQRADRHDGLAAQEDPHE